MDHHADPPYQKPLVLLPDDVRNRDQGALAELTDDMRTGGWGRYGVLDDPDLGDAEWLRPCRPCLATGAALNTLVATSWAC